MTLATDVIHQQRIECMKEKGLIPLNTEASPRLPGEPAWDELSDEQKKIEARKMEIYAAMIDDVDVNIERLLDYLKDINELDNTFIFFMSDNGAEGAPLDDCPVFGDWMKECCNNSYENLGKPDSYVFYGQNWGRVSTGPFRMYKGFTSEGGILVPAFANYPKLKNGGINKNFTSVMDVMPTLLDIANVQHPGTESKGRKVYSMKGVSLLPVLKGDRNRAHSEDTWMGWEVLGRRAITQDDWKLLFMGPPEGNGKWQLYNLRSDPAELNDLSTREPDRLNMMIKLWEQYATGNGIVPAEGGTVF